jgi:branched-chain amino acid transport system permease protein
MFELFGISSQALFGQLLIGLINGSFYALLSLGLAVIFGMLNIINFTHGAQYMLGAFTAYFLLQYAGLGYWWAIVLAPLIVGITGIIVERLFLQWLYRLDHLYGLLLTFGLALIFEGTFRNFFGSSGQPYSVPPALQGGQNLGFMFLPNYRAWAVVFSLAVCLTTWFVIERTKLGSYLRAATENPTLVRAFGINVPRMITLTYGFGVALAALAGVMAAPVYNVSPQMGQPHHRGVRGGRDRRHGLDHGSDRDRVRIGPHRGTHQGVLSRSIQHGDLHHHGDRAVDQAGRVIR